MAQRQIVWAEPSWRVSVLAVSPCRSLDSESWLLRFYGGERALLSRHGIPCRAFYRMDDGSELSFENAGERPGAIGMGGFARENSRRRLSKMIE